MGSKLDFKEKKQGIAGECFLFLCFHKKMYKNNRFGLVKMIPKGYNVDCSKSAISFLGI